MPAIAAAPDPVRARIEALSSEIRRHDANYYRNDAPEIADSEYDALCRELARLKATPPFHVNYIGTKPDGMRVVVADAEPKHFSRLLDYMDDGIFEFDFRGTPIRLKGRRTRIHWDPHPGTSAEFGGYLTA